MREYLPSFQTRQGALAFLHICVDKIQNRVLKDLARIPLEDPDFQRWPAASKNHHAYESGLIIHTAQVMATALDMVSRLNDPRVDELMVAVMWHDYAKIYDYQYLPPVEGSRPAEEYPKTSHYKDIGHLVGSVILFSQQKNLLAQLPVETKSFIVHLLLSHHGRKEWGSPVTPNCAEAWCLHAADMLSAQYTRDAHVGPSQ